MKHATNKSHDTVGHDLPVILFDMDDTIAATAPHWRQAETALLASLGRQWDAELAKQYKGMNALDVAATVHRLLSPAVSKEACQRVMRQALFDAYHASAPDPMAGAQDCVRRLAAAGHRMALASGSPLELIQLTLNHLDLTPCFELLISSESVARGKPNPDVFIAAAKAMNAQPQRCLVIEDSLIGVQAARTAGMRCVVIPSSASPDFEKLATRVCGSLKEVDSRLVLALT
jgi:sugar-phosphatase